MRITYDKEKVSFNLAKLKTHGEQFEVVINPDEALLYRQGKADVKDAVRAEHIFKDAIKGNLASENELKSIFGTDDPLKVAGVILKEGIIQLTDEHRERIRADKLKRIISIIHMNAIDPKTKLPHPVTRIENAILEAKVHADEHQSAEDQVQDFIKKIRTILPIKFATAELQIHLPGNFAQKLYGTLKRYGTISQESWLNDGSWKGIVTLPAGMKLELMDELNAATHGGANVLVLKEE